MDQALSVKSSACSGSVPFGTLALGTGMLFDLDKVLVWGSAVQRRVRAHVVMEELVLGELGGDDAKVVVAHHLDRALVLGQGIVEGDFLGAESFLFAALMCGADVLGEPDQFLKNLGRREGVAVVTGDHFLQPLGGGPGLHDVDPVWRRKLPVDELAGRLVSGQNRRWAI